MAKLFRPYIPLKVRVVVAQRQWSEANPGLVGLFVPGKHTARSVLLTVLAALFGDRPYALDHDPALVNRKRFIRKGKVFYQPAANDPAFLRYREAGPGSDHDIKTRVRGDGAKRSDLGQRRYLKNVAKARQKRSGAQGCVKRGRGVGLVGGGRKWPSRPFPVRQRGLR